MLFQSNNGRREARMTCCQDEQDKLDRGEGCSGQPMPLRPQARLAQWPGVDSATLICLPKEQRITAPAKRRTLCRSRFATNKYFIERKRYNADGRSENAEQNATVRKPATE
jgi:hypothetical protein